MFPVFLEAGAMMSVAVDGAGRQAQRLVAFART